MDTQFDDCPVLPTENGSLVLSTTDTADGTSVVIGCSGFGRHKTDPVNVFCSNGAWSPAPTTDCKAGFDEREVLILGVSVGCAVLILVVLILLCCSCFFYGRGNKRYHWWRSQRSGDGTIFINGGTNRYSRYSSPRNTVLSRHETILRDNGDIRPEWSRGRSKGYSHYERWGADSSPRNTVLSRHETILRDNGDIRPEWSRGRSKGYSHYERWSADNKLPTKTEVYTREAFIPEYDFFGSKQSVSKTTRDQVNTTQSRRHSDEFNGRQFQYTRSGGYSSGSGADMMRKSQYSASRQADYVTESPSVLEYRQFSTRQPTEHHVIETIAAPSVEPILQYTEQPLNVEFVEQTVQYVDNPIDYTSASFYTGRQTGPFILTNEMLRGYTTLGTSVTSLPRARIIELGDDSEMKVVPYETSHRSSNEQSLDPSIYFTGRQDFVPDSLNV